MRYSLWFAAALAFLPGIAQAAGCSLQHMKKIGHGRMDFMLMHVYDATLYAPGGVWHEGKSFALKLHYLRSLKGSDIARRSITEMRHTGITDENKLYAWQAQMEDIFPDVDGGTSLSGIYTPGGATVFCEKGHTIGRVDDPDFGPAFFNIWLSPKTSEPHLRLQLLGNTP